MKQYYRYQRDQETKLASGIDEWPKHENNKTATTPLLVSILARDTPCFVEDVDTPNLQSDGKLQHLVSLNSSEEG